ncbi:hypothetical protein J4Q44_G00260710 [Coregonus suidteri]|uniref:Uncharacterized protein n=1 Tax=Coregonus suidteri TaxID=861788 RepID=A0AAN8L2H9_9TELE
MHGTLYPRPYTVHQFNHRGHKTLVNNNNTDKNAPKQDEENTTLNLATGWENHHSGGFDYTMRAECGQVCFLAIAKPLIRKKHPQNVWVPGVSELSHNVWVSVFFTTQFFVLVLYLPDFLLQDSGFALIIPFFFI